MTDAPYGFAPPTTEDRSNVSIDIDDIAECENVELLQDWRRSFQIRADDMEAQIDARKITGTADVDWLGRVGAALGYSRMGIRRIDRRLGELTPRDRDVEDELRKHIKKLNDANGRLSARTDYERQFRAAAREVLNDSEYAEILEALDKAQDEPTAVAA